MKRYGQSESDQQPQGTHASPNAVDCPKPNLHSDAPPLITGPVDSSKLTQIPEVLPIAGHMKRKGGPRRVFGEEDRKLVTLLVIAGVPIHVVARVLATTENTLRRQFSAELEDAAAQAGAQVVGALLDNAIAGNVAAQIFWCKTKLGWRETDRLSDNGAQKVIGAAPLSNDEFEKMYAIDEGPKEGVPGSPTMLTPGENK